jgi:hypothetical protein
MKKWFETWRLNRRAKILRAELVHLDEFEAELKKQRRRVEGALAGVQLRQLTASVGPRFVGGIDTGSRHGDQTSLVVGRVDERGVIHIERAETFKTRKATV